MTPVPNPTKYGPIPTDHDPTRAFGILRDIYEIMGSTKSHLFPFSETTGSRSETYARCVWTAT